VAAFALHPMIVVYGASGMSEAAEAFFVVWCVRRLMLWSDSRHPGDLAGAGLALGFGYLVRYEMIPAAIGAAIFVGLATACGAGSGRRTRSLADMAIVLFPIVVSAAVWALGGWVVDQELFATVSSRYGNESIVRFTMRDNVPTLPAGSADWVGIAARMLGMQPFVGIAGGAAVIHWALTRKPTPLAPLAVIAPVLVFAAWGQATTTTFGYFRYYLLGVPLVICLALGFWAPPARRPQLRPLGQARRVGAALLCASVVAGFPVTVIASFNERIGNQPLQFGFKSLLFPDHTPGSAQDIGHRRLMVDDRLLADHLDRLELPDGSVLMDTFSGWGVWLSSARPKQFVITSDFDFKAALNRPWEYGVRYIVVGNPELYEADAVTVRYPSLWFDGAGMARPVYAVIGVAGEETLRLYRVTGRPRSPGLP
ncbi:MAG: hypothetical protein KIH64_017120, partial [Mycobacterium sp.]|nr:hypothetical protein [Mycobacterium sp.]